MILINYPTTKPSIKTAQNSELIFCIIRKRWFKITPEEWVRQNFLLYLTEILKYPAAIIAVEKQLLIAAVKKRFDIVIYKEAIPFIIIECKEMQVKLTENTISQVLNYNATIQAPYMIVTNGTDCAGFLKQHNTFVEIDAIPAF